MNRRILLIDADPAFRDTLQRQLARYRVEVEVETDIDAALTSASVDPPALVIIAVDEPDKSGFKVFQRLKKGVIATTKIALVTSSVVAESFAKHRGLKVHADEYFDKRKLPPDELMSRLGELLPLGAPAADELELPVEVDEIGVSDGEVVVDETVGDDEAEPVNASGTASSRIAVESHVAAETDAASDALAGQRPAEEPSRIVPPVMADSDAPPERIEPERAEPNVMPEAARRVVEDGGESLPQPPVPRDGVPITARELAERALAAAADELVESSPVIELDPDELIEEDPDEIPAPGPDDGRSLSHPREAAMGDSSAGRPSTWGPDPQHRDHEAPVAAAPVAVVVASPLPVPDLGLDQIQVEAAQDGTSSGIHDRLALRKVGELERQVSELKAELERARAAEAAPRPGGREREFLNLREQISTRDKEVAQVKSDLAVRSRELAETLDARAALEAIVAELEQRLTVVPELENRVHALASQVATLEQELDAKALIARDLAHERALRDATASEAERALREERAQLVERHENQLAELRTEHAAAQQAATDARREEHEHLIAAHEQQLATLRQDAEQQRATALDALRDELAAAQAVAVATAVETTRHEVTHEAQNAMSHLEATHTADLDRLGEEHAGALAQVVGERDAAHTRITRILEEHQAEVAKMQRSYASLANRERDVVAELAALHREHQASVETAERDLASALEARQREQRIVVEAKQREHSAATAKLTAEHAAALELALEQAREEHARALAARENELELQYAAAVGDVEHRAAQAAAAHAAEIARAKQEREELYEQAQATIAQLNADHERTTKEAADAHGEELVRAAEDKQRAIDELQLAAAEQRAVMDRTIVQLRDEATRYKEATDREIAEYRAALVNAKHALDDAIAQARAAHEAAEQAHAQAIAEQTALHERAMAVADGELVKTKALADAELRRTTAANDAELARVVEVFTAERDELTQGLSSTRDTLKQTQGELASAIDTIAARDADLRAHAQAIRERDERIAQLRAEIQTVETENAGYQEQVLRAYQKIKSDEVMVARAKKAMAIALTVLDSNGNPKAET